MNNYIRYGFLFFLLGILVLPINSPVELDNCKTRFISVDVKGEVDNPGIFTLEAYTTAGELLEMLKIRESADLSRINANVILKDGDVFVVPARREGVLQVSINSSTLEELTLLPGIGNKTAQNIIDYRCENGFFQTVDDLVKVKGIGTKTLEKIREYLTL